jgi:hypothetical protein
LFWSTATLLHAPANLDLASEPSGDVARKGAMRGEPDQAHLDSSRWKLAAPLLATLLTTLLATLLVTLLVMALSAALTTLLAALLTLSATSFLSLTLTARSLLTATLVFSTIVCHDSSSPVRNVNCLNCHHPENRIDLTFVAFIQNRTQRLS